jgi:hypothetical protein
MKITSIKINNDKLMEDIKEKDIFEFVNLIEIQKLLINYPQLYILFEFTCLHINSLIN